MHDIQSRHDVITLVDRFYDLVIPDDVLGYLFTEVNWAKHKPVMYDFWETMLLDNYLYKNNAMEVHFRLHDRHPLKPEHFARWMALFERTVQSHFTGPVAEEALKRARSIAGIMEHKVNQISSQAYGKDLI